ncbi:Integrase catalytic region (plasmid) [Sinorhizobium meliloti BL225C]|nr:Integrase catalytic region [Sinorhizobium meliloti BL225C]AEG07777.1 Integrase catalytic region [Sinorhizobium meliloti BL225C]SDY42526.1 Transposase [Sinorhizobium meliloti]SDZ52944.1 Transposase [Sinorhizobium meliloti]
MPAERLEMRRVREILRYRFEQGLGHKSIAVRVGAAPSTVRETLRRAAIAELSWPLGDDVSDAVLEAALYKAAGTKTGHRRSPEPDWAQVHRELKRKHMTLQILWDEYISRYPEGYRYSRFCDLYRGWAMKLPVTMRQDHAAGDKLFVDYAGDTVTVVVDRLSGKTRQAHLFVAVLGASSLSYAQARWSETLPDWIECHILALEFFGGAPALLVPDNAKVAIIKACHFDPQVNRTYCGMAAHYGSAVLPTRPRRPRDKAKVEAAVRIVERWLLGRLRHRIFYSLAEVNAAIGELLHDLNDKRVLRRVGVTRRQLFEELDRPALRPLPVERYVFAEWRIRRAGLDYHVEIERHYYSVPYRFAREQVEARITANTIEIFHKGERIAAHRRSSGNGKHTTIPDHMPSAHRRFADWTIERIQREASAMGPDVALLCERILADRPHPEQGFRACLGIIRLNKSFGRDRVNAACGRALEIGARTYGSVRSILDNHLDRTAASNGAASHEPIHHANIRGPRYYH